MKKIGVSACLLGHNVRYDGTSKKNEELLKLLEGQEVIAICPEVAGGFSVPHDPCEIALDKVISSENNDVTDIFVKGAEASLKIIEDCDFVVLKSKSPSCGYGKIYDGSFSGKLVDGNGIFARLCLEHKIKIFTEEDLDDINSSIQ